ncbi:hypothetical protein D3C84_1064890 [compost metagenome]
MIDRAAQLHDLAAHLPIDRPSRNGLEIAVGADFELCTQYRIVLEYFFSRQDQGIRRDRPVDLDGRPQAPMLRIHQ